MYEQADCDIDPQMELSSQPAFFRSDSLFGVKKDIRKQTSPTQHTRPSGTVQAEVYTDPLDMLPIRNLKLTPKVDETTYYPVMSIRSDYQHNPYLNTGYYPKYKEYILYEKRLETFKIWPRDLYQRGVDMAEAGFFYTGLSDKCMCMHCGIVLLKWENIDFPMKDHKYNSPLCKFVQANYNFRKHE